MILARQRPRKATHGSHRSDAGRRRSSSRCRSAPRSSNCLYRVDEILQPAGRAARRDLPRRRSRRSPPAGSTRTSAGRASRSTDVDLRAARLRRDPVGPDGADIVVAGRDRRQRRGLLHRGRCRRPTRGRSSRRSASSSTRSPSASATSSMHRRLQSALQNWQSARREPRHPREAASGGSSSTSSRKTDQQLLDAHLAQDAQPPLLERRRGGAAAAAPVRLGPQRRPTTSATDENRPLERRSLDDLLGVTRGRVPDRRRAPERATRSSPASRSGSRRTSPASSIEALENHGHVARPRSRDALERFHHIAARRRASSRRADADRACASRSSGASSPTTSSSSTSPRTTSRSTTSTTSSQHIICPPDEPREARRQERRACSSPRRSSARAAEYADAARRHQGARRPGTSPRTALLELHRVQQPRGRLQPEVPGDRPDPAGVPAHRPGLQELAASRPRSCKGLSVALDDFEDRPLIVRSSSLLEDRVGLGLLRQVQEPVPGQPGHQAGAARRR